MTTSRSSAGFQRRTAAGEAAILEALARRQARIDPRLRQLHPAQVQDPPDGGAARSAIAVSDLPAAQAAAGDRGLLAVNREPVGSGLAHEDLIREALRNRGRPYRYGGASRSGFDCSGFVCYLYKQFHGMDLPHSSAAQSRMGRPVARKDLLPGDLVFFGTYRGGVSHVGIYVGNDRFIHAANSRKDVRIDSLTGHYGRRYKWARRISSSPLKLSRQELDRLTESSSELPVEQLP